MKVTKLVTIVAWAGFLLAYLPPKLLGITHPSLDYVFLACGLTLFVSMVITWKQGKSGGMGTEKRLLNVVGIILGLGLAATAWGAVALAYWLAH